VYTGGEPINRHPDAEWGFQKEHVFYHSLTSAAKTLIAKDGDGVRIVDFEEFDSFAENHQNHELLHPFPRILEDFRPNEKPLFWCRLVCFGYICNEYLRRAGTRIGFEDRPYDLRQLLRLRKTITFSPLSTNTKRPFDRLTGRGFESA